jgi:hypothetical protein
MLEVWSGTTWYHNKGLPQLYTISDMFIVWQTALDNDFNKSKHVVLKTEFSLQVVVTENNEWVDIVPPQDANIQIKRLSPSLLLLGKKFTLIKKPPYCNYL